jgi:hypothetical protein
LRVRGCRPRGRRARKTGAGLTLAILCGVLTLPLASLAFAHAPAPFCGARGRCCCAGEATDDGGARPCLRQRCGCGQPGAAVIVAPLQVEAVLPGSFPLASLTPSDASPEIAGERPLSRADAPPVPPPRLSLPA